MIATEAQSIIRRMLHDVKKLEEIYQKDNDEGSANRIIKLARILLLKREIIGLNQVLRVNFNKKI